MVDVTERRELSFSDFDAVLEEVDRLASGEVRTVGNHTFGEILNHLAISHDVSAGRLQAPPPPLFVRLLMPLIRRTVIHSKPLKPGFKLPASGESFFWPAGEFETSSSVARFKESVEYFRTNGPLEKHPFFGKLTSAECNQLQCRHAALHLGFVHPA